MTLLRASLIAGAGLLVSGMAPVSHAKTASASTPPSRTTSRVIKIMQRLRNVRHFSAVALSPDGKSIAWIESAPNEHAVHGKRKAKAGKNKHARHHMFRQLLQIADADGNRVRTVTVGKSGNACHYRGISWAPSSRSLAFLAGCGKGKHGAQLDIYRVARSATRAHRVTHLNGFVHDLGWTADGSHLSFLYVKGDLHPIAAVSPTKARIGVIGRAGVEHQRLAVVPASGGAAKAVTPKSLFVYEYDWSPRGERAVYVAAPPPGRDNWWVAKLYTQRPGKAPHVVVDPSSVKGSLHGLQMALPRFSPDGSRIAFIGGLMSDQGATGGEIYVVSANGGQPHDVTPGITITPSWLAWTGKRSLLVSSFAGGSARISTFVLHGASPATHHQLFTVRSEVNDGTAASSVSLSDAHNRVAYLYSTFDSPPEIEVVSLKTDASGRPIGVARAPHLITHVNAGVHAMWGKSVSMHWTNGGFHVQGWLMLPVDYNPHKRYPMVVFVHGGPTYAWRPRWPFAGYGPAPLSAMGYFVFMPNPRGGFGEGERFTQAVRKDMGYGDLRDILAGVDVVEHKYPVDDKHLGITGWSYGGFMSMFAPTQTHRFKAAVIGAGLSDWKSYYGENSIDKWMIPFFGASVYKDPKAYAKSSAINFITHDKTPSLIVVGQYDGECPAPQSFEFWHGLRAMHVPTKLVVYAGEGHAFYKPQDWRNVLVRSLRWFHKYLGNG